MVKKSLKLPFVLRPYEDGQRQCPVKIDLVKRGTLGVFPLEEVICKRKIIVKYRAHPVYEDCSFHWSKKPKKTFPTVMLASDLKPDEATQDPMIWMSGAYRPFEWDCPKKIRTTKIIQK